MLVARGLSAVRGGLPLFRDVELRVGPGDAILLRGPNGSGKSTFLRALAAFEPVDRGEVILHDRPVASWPRWKREEIAPFVDQEPRLDVEVLAIDNLVDEVLLRRWWQWWVVSRAGARRAARESSNDLLEATGLAGAIDHGAWELSYGQRRLLTLVRALRPLDGERPRLLLLDEPFAGLSEARAAAVIEIINRRLAEGWAVIVAEHLAMVRRLEITDELEFPAI